MRFDLERVPIFSLNNEVWPGLTTQDVSLWLSPFEKGQQIFNNHIGSDLPNPPINLVPSHRGIVYRVCYVEGKGVIVVTFAVIKDFKASILKQNQGLNVMSTNAHLIRLGLCTTPQIIPIFTGIEENAHAYFDQVIKPTLDESDINFTGRHDGSDSSEEFAFQTIVKILLTNKELAVYPLPDNFYQQHQALKINNNR